MTQITKHSYFPTLETERLILRQMTLEDTDFVFQHFSDSAVSRYLMDEPPVTEYAQAQEIIRFYCEPEEGTHDRWLMVRKSDHRSIGTCGFHKWDNYCGDWASSKKVFFVIIFVWTGSFTTITFLPCYRGNGNHKIMCDPSSISACYW